MKSDDRSRIESFQHWMLDAVMHPDGVEGAATIDEIRARVLPSRALTAERRLGVYANMYYLRLVDILRDEFKALNYAVGAERFSVIARAYLARHPSRSENLRLLGRNFPGFLRDEAADSADRDLLVELARLERAMEEVFAEERATPIDASALESVPPEAWEGARFNFVPSLRLLALSRPANAFYQAWRDGKEPKTADWGDGQERILVYRRDWAIWRSVMEAAPYRILARLLEGGTLGEALEAALLAPGASEEDILGSVGENFRKWSGLQLITGIELAD